MLAPFVIPLPSARGWATRLDPRVKIIALLAAALPCLLLPYRLSLLLLALLALPLSVFVSAGLPPGAVLRRWLTPMPFVLLLALWHPWIAPAPAELVGWPFAITVGWVRALRIVCSGLVLVGMLLAVASTTPTAGLLAALHRLRVPHWLVLMFSFILRYLTLLSRRACDLQAARQLRFPGMRNRGLALRLGGSALGHFLVRTLYEAEQVEQALTLRGFDGRYRLLTLSRLARVDYAVLTACCGIALATLLAVWQGGF